METKTKNDLLTPLQRERLHWKPEVPFELCNLPSLKKQIGSFEPSSEPLLSQFPHIALLPTLSFVQDLPKGSNPKKVGVILSGGQASGGHNVIAGLLDGLQSLHPDSKLFGFLNGPKGLLEGKFIPLTSEVVAPYRNQGGFDLIGSGRDKIQAVDQFEMARKVVEREKIESIVMVGGDDSNTTAAYLAEYFAMKGVDCAVIGIPKTIDGDLRSDSIQISFGFDTACKTYAEMIGNISRDILSAKKYYAFIRLMGRSASHIALECARMTHPNLTLITEEVQEKRQTLSQIVAEIADLVVERAALQKQYGVILLPEGLIEALPDFKNEPFMNAIDPHGNLQVSQIETERFLIELVTAELQRRDPNLKFSPLPFFLGYEGRSAMPSNFDANYGYALGLTAAMACDVEANGYICTLHDLKRPAQEWTVKLVPLIRMLGLENRKGEIRAVVKKAYVDLNGSHFIEFKNQSKMWRTLDEYRYWGPIQFFGPKELTDAVVEI